MTILEGRLLLEGVARRSQRRTDACSWWLARVVQALRRRKKKDWNEVLRLVDLATMDYKP